MLWVFRIIPENRQSLWVGAIGLMFLLPFVLASLYSGYFADRFEKTRTTKVLKATECFIMALAVFAFWCESLVGSVAVLFAMGMQSAFFAPVKYGYLPELTDTTMLRPANSVLQFSTFTAILLATAFAGITMDFFYPKMLLLGLVLLLLSGLGMTASLFLTPLYAKQPNLKFSLSTHKWLLESYFEAKTMAGLRLIFFGSGIFWFSGVILQMNLLVFFKSIFMLSDTHVGWVLMSISLGMGLGGFLAKRWEHSAEIVGAFCFAGFLFVAPLFSHLYLSVLFFFGTALAAGFMLLPINVFLQVKPKDAWRGRVIALSQFIDGIAMVLAALLYTLVTAIFTGATIGIFLVLAAFPLLFGFLTLKRSRVQRV